jgi:serine/threonine protein kinase
LADALAFSHEKGFIHADVKPENVLVVSTHCAEGLLFLDLKLCDFGICVHESEEREGRSSAGGGTRSSRSPEQASGGAITAKSDVWSLTVLATALLGKCAAPYSLRTADLRDEQDRSALLDWMNTNSNCLWTSPFVHFLCAGVEASPHSRPSMHAFLSRLLLFADANSLCNIEALEVFDMVIIRHDLARKQSEAVEKDREYHLLKMIWSAEWHAEVTRAGHGCCGAHLPAAARSVPGPRRSVLRVRRVSRAAPAQLATCGGALRPSTLPRS